MPGEIHEIPARARACLEASRGLRLPTGVPYIGMGSSHFATLVLRYAGADIHPEAASEYFHSRSGGSPGGEAVLLSQSGRSSETLWCRELFDCYTAITNDPDSPLAAASNCRACVELRAGKESGSATKSYYNTLLALYAGLGFGGVGGAIAAIAGRMDGFEETGRELAGRLHRHLQTGRSTGLAVIGAGPNYGTALQGALILSECSKRLFTGLSVGQYDHGPKETARDSFVIALQAKGADSERTQKLLERIEAFGATTHLLDEQDLDGPLSPLALILPLNLAAVYLADKLGIEETFSVGGKVTEGHEAP